MKYKYCRYCSFCVSGDAYYCTCHDKELSHVDKVTTCKDFCESEHGDVDTGRKYSPRNKEDKWIRRAADSSGACTMVDHACAQCGKIFLPAPYHVYKRSYGSGGATAWLCSYHCMLAWDKEHPTQRRYRTMKN